MASETAHLILIAALVFALGLCVGSFLNVLALRVLAGRDIAWPASQCAACRQRIRAFDNIPLLSFFLLRGRCRYCRAAISWQYPLVELVTAVALVALVSSYGLTIQAAGLSILVCTLIAVTVTDFRERLIPHDITYPSLLLGICFSALVRHDLLGAMAGIGASYIVFDLIAHYGLKLYLILFHARSMRALAEPGHEKLDQAPTASGQAKSGREMDELEVIGGGDAVLSAVISAWLGWQKLVVALVVAFIIGALIGVGYLLKEMRSADILHLCYRPAATFALIGFLFLSLPALVLGLALGLSAPDIPWLALGSLGALLGSLVGVVSVGTRVSKPFPFGPALAFGGLVAVFWKPGSWPGGA